MGYKCPIYLHIEIIHYITYVYYTIQRTRGYVIYHKHNINQQYYNVRTLL